MSIKQRIKKLLVLFLKNNNLMINGDYADKEIIVASIDEVEDKIIHRVIELNEKEEELEIRGNSILDGNWLFFVDSEDFFDGKDDFVKELRHDFLNIINEIHNEYVKIMFEKELDFSSIDIVESIFNENISQKCLDMIMNFTSKFNNSEDFGVSLNYDIDLSDIKKFLIQKSIEVENITDDLEKIVSEKEGIRLELIKTLDKSSLLPNDDVFNKYCSAREYIVNERRTTRFRENLEFMGSRYSVNDKFKDEFIDNVEEKVYFFDEIRDISMKYNGYDGVKKNNSDDKYCLTKLQLEKLNLIISSFNFGKNSVENSLAGRKHQLFINSDKADFIIKKGSKLIKSISNKVVLEWWRLIYEIWIWSWGENCWERKT